MTLEIDLVRALREPEYREEISAELLSDITDDVVLEAADEIERLREVLKTISSPSQTSGLLWWQRAARRALAHES